MDMTKAEYRRMSQRAVPHSPVLVNCLKAFGVGGLICLLGQAVVLLADSVGFGAQDASMIGSVSLILLSVVLTGLNVFDDLARHAGAGTLVPITGFANAVCSPAIEFKTEGFVLGVGAKMFAIAGPVIVYGVAASVLYGIIYYLITLL